MSLANKKLTPIPVGDGSGKFWETKKQYGGIKQIVRRFRVEGGRLNMGDNVDTYVFDDYGTLDGSSTAPAAYLRSVPAEEKFANCYLENQGMDKGNGDGKETIVTKVYQEAYETLREIAEPEETTDENGRKGLRRTYIVLNGFAPDFDPAAGIVRDVADASLALLSQSKKVGNAVTVVTRNFVQVTDSPVQVGRDIVSWTENGLKLVEQSFIVERGYDLSTFGTVGATTGASGEISGLYLSALTNTAHNETTSVFVARWAEEGILRMVTTPQGDGLRQVSVVAIGSQPSIDGIISEISEDNYEGFKTWRIEAIQSSDGGDPTSGVASNAQAYVNFDYPGEASVDTNTVIYPGIIVRYLDIGESSPISKPVLARVRVTYQASNTMPSLEHPIWAPDSWVSYRATWITTGDQPKSLTGTLRGYRMQGSNPGPLTSTPGNLVSLYGTFVPVGSKAEITLSGGPPDPSSNTYVINRPRLEEAFTGEDGTKYYKLVQVIATL